MRLLRKHGYVVRTEEKQQTPTRIKRCELAKRFRSQLSEEDLTISVALIQAQKTL